MAPSSQESIAVGRTEFEGEEKGREPSENWNRGVITVKNRRYPKTVREWGSLCSIHLYLVGTFS